MQRAMRFLVLLSVSVVLLTNTAAEDLYTSKYDGINVDNILQNSRLRNQYLKCYLGTGPCVTPDARFLKEKLPEVLVTSCRRCTEKQKEFFEKVTVWYAENEPESWNAVVKKTIEDVKKKKKEE